MRLTRQSICHFSIWDLRLLWRQQPGFVVINFVCGKSVIQRQSVALSRFPDIKECNTDTGDRPPKSAKLAQRNLEVLEKEIRQIGADYRTRQTIISRVAEHKTSVNI
ncbi:MAG: hypothetical protein EAZ33_28890 [Oscillatoriales cyanobacterium]|nr:MAG: hypothetical protein EAZ33_28890 [Oscillatoriales cyanobacterium]